jgi:hypothetical protein
MTNLKELAQKYYKEMGSDSKRKSAEAERKLCKILNHVITKMETIETVVDYGVRNYPYRIYKIEYDGYYGKLPENLECNQDDDDFIFETSWFDLDYEAYYKELKAKHINSINYTIEKVEQSLENHRKEIQRLSKSKFSDIEFHELVLEED